MWGKKEVPIEVKVVSKTNERRPYKYYCLTRAK